MKKTLVLGATPNPSRYSYLAVQRLLDNGHEVIPVGIRKNAVVHDLPIMNGQPSVADVDTITLYLSPKNQQDYYEYIIGISPKRIIFNPGTENPELIQLAKANDIEVEIACTLVLLSTDQY